MRSRIGAGALAGLAGGVVWGVLLSLMQTLTLVGGDVDVSMMSQIGRAVRSESLLVAWGVHLLISVALGVLFGVVAGRWADRQDTGAASGLAFGLLVWVFGWQVAMPLLLGEPVFGFVRELRYTPFAVGSLMGHIIYGAVLGGGVGLLRQRGEREAARLTSLRRAA